jgi:formyltetrahydrofolate deformylase
MERRILLIECPDRKGLVHQVTGVLYRHGLNVTGNAEFVDRLNGRFFMRTEFEGPPGRGPDEKELRDVLPEGHTIRLVSAGKKRVVILVSKEPHCVGDLLVRHAYDQLPAEILAVVGNHERLRPLVEGFGVPFHHVPSEGRSREAHEAALEKLLGPLRPDLLVLAKYMRILGPSFVARFERRIVNIHHSFLPAFVGAQPYRQAYERGVKIIGATAHFVTSDLDQGPIIAQSVVAVDHSHDAEDMAQRGMDAEKTALARGLQLVLEDRVFVSGNRTVVFE